MLKQFISNSQNCLVQNLVIRKFFIPGEKVFTKWRVNTQKSLIHCMVNNCIMLLTISFVAFVGTDCSKFILFCVFHSYFFVCQSIHIFSTVVLLSICFILFFYDTLIFCLHQIFNLFKKFISTGLIMFQCRADCFKKSLFGMSIPLTSHLLSYMSLLGKTKFFTPELPSTQ